MDRTNRSVRSPSPRFFQSGAGAAAVAVGGVLLAQLALRLDRTAGPELDSLVRAYAHPTFQAQSLTILIQVIAMFVALIAVAVKVFPLAPGLTVLAAAALLIWQVLELVPRSVDYFVLSLQYAPAYLAGTADPAMVDEEFNRYFAWERGWRTIRQSVWAAGLLLIGSAARHAPGLGRMAGALLLVNGARVALLFLLTLAGAAMPFGRWLFVVVNVGCFGLVAVWLWQRPHLELQANSTRSARTTPPHGQAARIPPITTNVTTQ